jgi:D-alanyl-D-alanine carboxypeptidase
LPFPVVVGQSPLIFNRAESRMLNDANRRLHRELGIPADYGQDDCPPFYPEALELVEIGPNLVGRMQSLTPLAAARWQQMVEAASRDGVRLLIVSGFRSFDYQAELIRRKIDAGQKIEEILTVNAAPGFSQHHTGAAVDIATPGCRPLTEEFDQSGAFAWLAAEAANFGFSMTYPRNNPWGFIYEPWHWALEEAVLVKMP